MLRRWFGHPTMTDIDRQLPPRLRRRPGRRTLVVVADDQRQVSRLAIGESRWARAHVVPVLGRSPDELHRELSALGNTLALVVDARASSGPAQLDSFEVCFFHLPPRGAWVALRTTRPGRRGEPLVDLARRLEGLESPRQAEERWREHARSVAGVRITPELLVVRKRKRHLLRLREEGAPALLRTREPGLGVTEIARLDGGVLDTTGWVHDYGATPHLEVPAVLRYPEHTAWRYDGLVRLPRAPLAHHGRSVLPDSFRWHLTPQPTVTSLRNVDEHFSRLPKRQWPEPLEGRYFHLAYGPPGHFGHLMTEALSKLWAWGPAKAADPDLKILVRRRHATGEPGPEQRLLPAFGIAPEDIEWVDGPVAVTSLVGCTPMWHNAPPFYVHPAIRETWARFRSGLIGDDPVEPVGPIFVTRRQWNRPCSNVDDVERFFADRGFAIVAPEEHTLAEQVAMFAGARVVAGFGGAGMFNLAYAESVETVIVLNQSAYHARNEHLFAAVRGAQLHTFWSSPDVDHPPGGYSYDAHQSSWTFDFDANGAHLDRLIEGLVQ